MTVEVQVILDAERPAVLKTITGDDAARGEAEAARLAAAEHPGVVELLESSCDPERVELRLAYGGRPLDAVARLSVEEVAAVAAAVAETLADLHGAGIVHGRLDATHVLLGAAGRPLLCGIGDGTGLRGEPAAPADDVAAVGRLLTGLLEGQDDLEPIPDRRWARRRSWNGWGRRALLNLADQATDAVPERRPSARRLAAELAAAVPAATLPAPAPREDTPPEAGPDAGQRLQRARITARAVEPGGSARRMGGEEPTPARGAPRRRPARIAGAAAAVLLTVLGGARVTRPGAPDQPAPPPPAPASIASTTVTTTAPATVPPPADVGDPLPRVEGRVVEVDGRRFEVGAPGDLVTVGDWTCDGTATAAVLRPRTGEVFVFSRWTRREALTVEPISVVDGASHLSARRSGACDRLVVRRGTGEPVTVDPGANG
jgi:eukaryotic-like serine/threonine-protein kinase